MSNLEGRKPILCLDFDGTCSQYSGWKGPAVIPDPPVPGLFEFLLEVNGHFEVHIFSSRTHQEGGLNAMRDWFIENFRQWHARNMPSELQWPPNNGPAEIINDLLTFATEKPPAQITIDARGILFTGEWPSLETLKAFKPWYQKDKSAYL